jgi:hypothetical protein
MKDWVHIRPCNTCEVFPLQDLFEARRAGIFFKILALIRRGGTPWGGAAAIIIVIKSAVTIPVS